MDYDFGKQYKEKKKLKKGRMKLSPQAITMAEPEQKRGIKKSRENKPKRNDKIIPLAIIVLNIKKKFFSHVKKIEYLNIVNIQVSLFCSRRRFLFLCVDDSSTRDTEY
jgi:hypothetical protein